MPNPVGREAVTDQANQGECWPFTGGNHAAHSVSKNTVGNEVDKGHGMNWPMWWRVCANNNPMVGKHTLMTM